MVVEKIAESIVIGTSRILFVIGIGHPFDLIKTKLQAFPDQNYSTLFLLKNIYHKEGFLGFYKGFLPNFSRSIFKESYRSPLRGFLDYYYLRRFPNNNRSIAKLFTAFSMSIVDTVILCPLERLKVWMMTNQNKNKMIRTFWKERTSGIELTSYLFRGLTVSLIRSLLSWTSFLVVEEKIRFYITNRTKNRSNQISWYKKFLIGTIAGISNGLITQPFDTIKTIIQKSGSKDKVSIYSIFEVGRMLYMNVGLRGIYAGFGVRLFHYSIVGIITSDVIQRVDDVWNK